MRSQTSWMVRGFLAFLLSSGSGIAQQPGSPAAARSKEVARANSDPNYRALRDGKPGESFTVSNLTLKRDVGTFVLRSGRVSFLPPVLDRVVIGVFVGDGEFTLTPAIPVEQAYLRLVTEQESVRESFDRLVLCFTDDTYQEIRQQAQAGPADPSAEDALRELRRRLRKATDEDIENREAELLASLYNPNRDGSFRAYLFGRQHKDLRYVVEPRGALPGMPSPEEVALLNGDPEEEEAGIWYLAHGKSEYESGKASSGEDKRSVDVQHYQIETSLRDEKLTASARVTFAALESGDRVLRFGLLPSLRVSRVTSGGEREMDFIQEKEEEDGSLYVVLPEPVVSGETFTLRFEYQGEKVQRDAGGGNFSVGARTSWYPSVNAFGDRATFDLTFKVPNKYVLVSVGKLAKQSREGDLAVSQWVSAVPLAVAGFNFGRFEKKEVADEPTRYQIEGYATAEVPDYMRPRPCMPGETLCGGMGGMSPKRLMDDLMVETQNSVRLFSKWFGESPYGRIAVTQQPQFSFGQSWPSLVYLPVSAFLDSTQRWMLMGNSRGFTDFIQEVTPHEVAHQWWGHLVGWSSYHDQWLSEGFADFSASLYLQMIEQKSPDRYLHFWEQNRKTILEKNEFGRRANDAGPIWMGYRLNTKKTPGAYNQLVYPKGGFVLHMLRWLMWDPQTADQRFIAMMQDFVKSYLHQNASTETFKKIVEKHMTDRMDLDGNRQMNWFFDQWVYGTQVPRYQIVYSLAPQSDGKILLTAAVTQSEVSPDFKMVVPIYLDLDGRIVRLGVVNLTGNVTAPELKVLLPQRPRRVLLNAYHDVLAVESISKEK